MTDYAALLAEVREIADRLSRVASYDILEPHRQCQLLYQDAQRIAALVGPHCPPILDEATGDDYLRTAARSWHEMYGGMEPTP